MPQVVIHNSMTGAKEPLAPLEPGVVKMYVCGMTVYDYCHIGHARVMVGFDVVTRYLEYCGYEVRYVRNITDVDDKIFNRARDNNEDYQALTQRFIAAMHEDERALNVRSPLSEPRATEHMDEIVAMIETLVAKGFAYRADNGDVYYRVTKFAGYGKLSKRNIDDLRAGARVEIGEDKENPLDFALWKAAKKGEAAWPSPWGSGRPGWHIECSAMSTCAHGATFDIHGGGPDLKFPHHENEIAQSEAATGKPFVNTWMHAGPVRVDNEKMSKSLGNFFTIREVLQKYNPEVVRYLLLASHYRSPINYSEDNLKEAQSGLERFYLALRKVQAAASTGDDTPANVALAKTYQERFEAAMSDDFNTPVALAALFDLVREINRQDTMCPALVDCLKRLGTGVLGLFYQEPEDFLQDAVGDTLDAAEIETLIDERNQARADKNWERSDEIRQQLLDRGIILDDSREGTSWRTGGD